MSLASESNSGQVYLGNKFFPDPYDPMISRQPWYSPARHASMTGSQLTATAAATRALAEQTWSSSRPSVPDPSKELALRRARQQAREAGPIKPRPARSTYQETYIPPPGSQILPNVMVSYASLYPGSAFFIFVGCVNIQ